MKTRVSDAWRRYGRHKAKAGGRWDTMKNCIEVRTGEFCALKTFNSTSKP